MSFLSSIDKSSLPDPRIVIKLSNELFTIDTGRPRSPSLPPSPPRSPKMRTMIETIEKLNGNVPSHEIRSEQSAPTSGVVLVGVPPISTLKAVEEPKRNVSPDPITPVDRIKSEPLSRVKSEVQNPVRIGEDPITPIPLIRINSEILLSKPASVSPQAEPVLVSTDVGLKQNNEAHIEEPKAEPSPDTQVVSMPSTAPIVGPQVQPVKLTRTISTPPNVLAGKTPNAKTIPDITRTHSMPNVLSVEKTREELVLVSADVVLTINNETPIAEPKAEEIPVTQVVATPIMETPVEEPKEEPTPIIRIVSMPSIEAPVEEPKAEPTPVSRVVSTPNLASVGKPQSGPAPAFPRVISTPNAVSVETSNTRLAPLTRPASSPNLISIGAAIATPTTVTVQEVPPPNNPDIRLVMRDNQLVVEFHKHEQNREIIVERKFSTEHWLIAKIMNFFASIFPCCVQGAALFSIDGQVHYIRRSSIQKTFDLQQRGAFDGSDALENANQLRATVLAYFKNK